MQTQSDEAFIDAIRIQSHEIVQELLGQGQNVNARDNEGKPALLIAVECQNLTSARDLLRYGAT